ncbi:MAG: hypothetical protein DHS20C15_11270 [Planctomycetota bacterium]|nr:MAG: hypothetical protein DHS20C15_11270 [Planctomycetota bacterium]
MSLSRRVSRNALGQIAGRLYTSALAFVITALVLPRTMSGELFGIFAFHHTLWQLLNNVLDFGTGTVVIRESSRRRSEAGSLIGMLVTTKALLATAGVLVLVAVAWFGEGSSARFLLLALAAPLLLAHAPAAANVIFHVDMRFGPAVLASALGQSVWLLGTLAMAFAGVVEPALYIAAFGLGIATNALLSWRWAKPLVSVELKPDPSSLRALWKESWPAGVSLTMASVYFYIDALMLRPLVGEVATGHYKAAYSVMTFALMVPVLVSNVLYPIYARLWERGAEALRPFFGRSLATLAAFGLCVAATLPVVARDVMAIVFEAPFLDAAPTLATLSLAIGLVFCTYPHVLLLLAAGHQRTMMWVSVTAAAFNVIANWVLIPEHGMLGAAVTTVLTELLVLVGAALAGRRLTGLSAGFANWTRPLLAAGLAAAAAWWLVPLLDESQHLLRLGAALALGVAGVFAAGVLPVDLGTEEGAPE